jgi:glycosyltransferase involved in cell wall biosynthesis
MNICMFTNTYLPHVGGVARSVSIFSRSLRNAGHSVLTIAPTYPGFEEYDKSEPEVFRVPAIQNFNGSDFSARVPLPFFVDEQIEAFEPDIVHSHHPYLLGDTALRIARRKNLPLIFTHHTLYEEYIHYILKNPGNLKRFAAFLSTNYANLCDRVIAPSKSIEELIRKRGVTVPIEEIPTGVDIDFFSSGNGGSFRKKCEIPPNSFVVGHLGRLAPEKNIDYLATAVAHTLAKREDAYFLVVGQGPGEPTIKRIFDDLGVEKRLIMAGKKTGQLLADAYGAMDLFAFASKTETQGMVLTEAMAAGVPVVALDAPGAREVITDEQNGRLLDDQCSIFEFSDALLGAIAAPVELAIWADAARSTARRFSRERTTECLINVYAGILGADRGTDARHAENLDLWDKFLRACKAEWDLIAEKTESIIQMVGEDKGVAGPDAPD